MNFNWANELAKNALKTAQKRIDSVLDITPEDAEDDEEVHTVIASPVEQSSLGERDGTEAEPSSQSPQHDGWDETNASFYSVYDGTSKQNVEVIPEAEKSTSPPEWASQWVDQTVEVVDSEPNPIRDSHHAGLLPHSPCSNSPEELVCSGEESPDTARPNANDTRRPKEAEEKLSDLQLSVLEDAKRSVIIDNVCPKNEKHHDDSLTLISSDFEVLRQSDSCSMASSVPPKNLPAFTPDNTSTAEQHQQTAEVKEDSVNKQQSINSEIAHLRSQIQHQERRIRDLQFQNQRLEVKSKELLALKAVRTQQNTTEAKLLKKLSDKEAELADLLQEGEKLAKTNGKLTSELKKLRASLTEQEQLVKKGAQAEIDRDLSREEVRGLTAEATKLRNMIKSLEADLAKSKVANEGLMADLKKKDDKINKLMADIQQSEASRELAYEEMKRLETVMEEVSSKAEQREMSSKGVEEITRALNADLEEEKRKNERQAAYVDSLEKRLSEMMETQRNNAEMIATASAPLLESIQRLEAEVSAKDNECEQIIREKETIVRTLSAEKERLAREIVTENEKLQERLHEKSTVVQRQNERIRQLEQQNARLEACSSKLSHKVDELTMLLSKKDDEIERVYVRLRDETDALEKRIAQKESEIDTLRKHSEILEEKLRKKAMEQNDEYVMQQQKRPEKKFDSVIPNGDTRYSAVMNIPTHAVQIELADALAKYEQSMRQISILEEKISSMEAESQHLGTLRRELQALRLRYENLLEAHGEKIERIEELELDLADVKKLLKDQVEYFLGKS